MWSFPKVHPTGHPTTVIVAPGAALGLEYIENIFQCAQPVAVGVVPDRIEDHRGCKQLRAAQDAGPASDWFAVFAQAPSGIKGLAENMRCMPCQNGFKPHLR